MTATTRTRRNAAARRPAGRGTTNRSPRLPILPLAAAAVVLLAVVAALVSAGGDADEAPATAPVTIDGAALPPYQAGVADPAVGMPAPALEGTDLRGSAMGLSPGEHPTVVLFAAHWCGYCQAEVEELAPWLTEGGQGQVSFLTISTAVDAARPNYPPAAWFAREGWPGAVMTDSSADDAARAFGVTGYPFFVFLDADGRVVGRMSGNVGHERLAEAIATLEEAPAP